MRAVTIPILPSGDFDVTARFWSAFGFEPRGRWPGEYLILRNDALDIELHFWSKPTVDRWTNDVACYVRFPDRDAALACRAGWDDVRVDEPARFSTAADGVGGSTEFHLIDLHGNLVRFGGFPA